MQPGLRAANLISFWKYFHLHTLSKTYRFIYVCNFSFQDWFSPTYMNEKKSFLHNLIKTYTFSNSIFPAYMYIRTYTIIRQVRVNNKKTFCGICKRDKENSWKHVMSTLIDAIFANPCWLYRWSMRDIWLDIPSSRRFFTYNTHTEGAHTDLFLWISIGKWLAPKCIFSKYIYSQSKSWIFD